MATIINLNNERFEVTGIVELKSVRNQSMKAMWSGFMGVATAGMNSITNRLNSLLNNNQLKSEDKLDTDYKAPFKAIEIDTGLRIELAPGEVLRVYTPVSNVAKGIVLACGDMITESGPIKLYFYNMTATDTILNAGEVIAFGEVNNVGVMNNINYIIDNTQYINNFNDYNKSAPISNQYDGNFKESHYGFSEVEVKSTGINLKKE